MISMEGLTYFIRYIVFIMNLIIIGVAIGMIIGCVRSATKRLTTDFKRCGMTIMQEDYREVFYMTGRSNGKRHCGELFEEYKKVAKREGVVHAPHEMFYAAYFSNFGWGLRDIFKRFHGFYPDDKVRRLGSKVGLFIDYLKAGNEFLVEGQTYVWLDNHVVKETETHQYVIDGLAIKMYDFKDNEPSYIGASDKTIQSLVDLVDKIDSKDIYIMHDYLYG